MRFVFVNTRPELFRFTEQENSIARQEIKQCGERFFILHFAFITLPLLQDSQFAGRRQGDGNNLLTGNLRERVEVTERFQFIAKKFQTDRPRAGRRKNIENATAQGDFTFLRNLRLRS